MCTMHLFTLNSTENLDNPKYCRFISNSTIILQKLVMNFKIV